MQVAITKNSRGYKIRQLRNKLGLFQREFAKLFGGKINQNVITNWELNRYSPNIKHVHILLQLAKKAKFRLTLDDIIFEPKNKKARSEKK